MKVKSSLKAAVFDGSLIREVDGFPAVARLAENVFRMTAYPVGFALHSLLIDAANDVINDLSGFPNYRMEVAYVKSVIFEREATAKSLGEEFQVSREHISRAVRPNAFEFISKVFQKKASMMVSPDSSIGSRAHSISSV